MTNKVLPIREAEMDKIQQVTDSLSIKKKPTLHLTNDAVRFVTDRWTDELNTELQVALEMVFFQPTQPVVVHTYFYSGGHNYSVEISLKDTTQAEDSDAPKQAADSLRKLFNSLIENGMIPKDPQALYTIDGHTARGSALSDLGWTKFLITQADDFCNLFEKTLEKDRSVNNDKDMALMLDRLLSNLNIGDYGNITRQVSAADVRSALTQVGGNSEKTATELRNLIEELHNPVPNSVRKSFSSAGTVKRRVNINCMRKDELDFYKGSNNIFCLDEVDYYLVGYHATEAGYQLTLQPLPTDE